ncbi:MAG: isochorismatase family protein, partial [Promethearchaeota archaeon]
MSNEKKYYQKNISLSRQDALIIVDMQNDFMPRGALPVEEGDQIIDGINIIAKIFKENNGIVVLTQDWHPKNHMSFASSHFDKNPGDKFQSIGIG